MKKITVLALMVLICAPGAMAAKKEKKSKAKNAVEAPAPEMTNEQKESYSLGANLGESMKENFKRAGIEINYDLFAKGVMDGLKEQITLSQTEMDSAFVRIDAHVKAKAEADKLAQEKEANSYLEANKAKANVIVTESGLQYEVLVMGNGPKPAATDNVKVHYIGTKTDGTVFDSSVERGEPITFPLNQVIPGWTEGVQLMPVGSKFKFVIPGKLAYGERGAGGVIKPNETLIFEVELLEINPQE